MTPALWLRRLVVVTLAVLTIAYVIGPSSVRTAIEQRRQTQQAEHEAARLDTRIAELTAEVEVRTSPEGVLREALCFGHYVEPGVELYAVVGVSGCVTGLHQ